MTETCMILADVENSYNCQEGSRFPSADNYLYFPDNIVICQEGAEMTELIQHHKKYKEIHGADEIVLMTRSEHKKLHIRLRKQGKCKLPSNLLAKVSMQAYKRTDKAKTIAKVSHKKYRATYQKTVRFSERIAENIYLREEIIFNQRTGNVCVSSYFYGQKKYPEYSAKRKAVLFTETIGKNIRLFEAVYFNGNTNQITFSSFFVPSNGMKLKEFDEFDEE